MNAQSKELTPAMSPEAGDLSDYFRRERARCQSKLRGVVFVSEYHDLRSRIAHYTKLIRSLEGQL